MNLFNRILSFLGYRVISSTTHLERTKSVQRNSKMLVNAVITELYNVSPTIKFLSVKIDEHPNLDFKPGQWVDFHIPNLSVVGGYSMCSTPKLLKEKNELHLAVKKSDHEPAAWVHNKCKNGSKIQLKVGGEVYYDKRNEGVNKHILLIAGGVGINPLFSIFQNNYEILLQQKEDNASKHERTEKTILMYSATSEDELIFKKTIDEVVSTHDLFSASYFVTRASDSQQFEGKNMKSGRIKEKDLEEALNSLSLTNSNERRNVLVFLCGPGPMMSEMKDILIKLGVNEHDIRFESWW